MRLAIFGKVFSPSSELVFVKFSSQRLSRLITVSLRRVPHDKDPLISVGVLFEPPFAKLSSKLTFSNACQRAHEEETTITDVGENPWIFPSSAAT